MKSKIDEVFESERGLEAALLIATYKPKKERSESLQVTNHFRQSFLEYASASYNQPSPFLNAIGGNEVRAWTGNIISTPVSYSTPDEE